MSKLRNMFSTRKCMQIAPETEMMHELTPEELAQVMASLEDEMSRASADMDFERAAALRDQLVELKSRFEGGSAVEVMERLKAGARKGSAHASRRRYRGKH